MSYNRDKKEARIVPTNSLVVSTSTVLDGSSDIVLVNGPAFSPGFQADLKAVDFNINEELKGSNSTVGIADTFSMSLWWKPVTVADSAILAIRQSSGTNNDIMWNQTGGEYRIRVDDSTLNPFLQHDWPVAGLGSIQVGTWINLTFTWDGPGQTLLIYADGQLVTPSQTGGTGTPNLIDSARQITLTDNTTGAAQGQGIMHSLGIWNVELDATAITAIYNSGSGAAVDLATNFGNYTSSANLRHWYRLGFLGEPDIGKDSGNLVRDLTSAGSETIADSDIVNDFPSGEGGAGLVSVTLPLAADNNGLEITVKDNSGNAADGAVSIVPGGSDTINLISGDTLTIPFESKTYVSDGVVNWSLIGSNALDAQGAGGITGETGSTGATGETGAAFLDATSLIEQFSVQSLGVVDDTDIYCMSQSLPFAATILEAFGEVGPTGAEVQITVELDGVPVTGLSGATFTNSSIGYSATSSNVGETGQKLTAVVVGATMDPDDLCLTVVTQRQGGGGTTNTFQGALIHNSTQEMTSGENHIVTFDTEIYDIGGWFDSGTDATVFVVPGGVNRVRVAGQLSIAANATGDRHCFIELDTGGGFVAYAGEPFVRNTAVATGNSLIQSISGVLDVSPGDEFRLVGVQDSGSPLDLAGGGISWFSIEAAQGGVQGGTGMTGMTGETGSTGDTGMTGQTGPGPADFSGALIRKDANQILTTAVGATATWDTEIYDVGGWFDFGANDEVFTIPAGVNRVRVSVNGRFESDSVGRRELLIRLNGATFPGSGIGNFDAVTGDNSEFGVQSAVFDVTPGNTISVLAFQNSGGDLNLQNDDRTWFQIEAVPGGIKGDVGETGATGSTGAVVGPDFSSITMNGTDEEIQSASTTMGFANAFSIMSTVRPTDLVTGTGYWLKSQQTAGDNNSVWFSVEYGVVNDPTTLRLFNSASSTFKRYQYNNLAAYDEWQQFLITWDGTDLELYKNGVAQVPDSIITDVAGTMTDTARVFQLSSSEGFLGGNYHSAAVWNSVLTVSEALSLWNDGNGPTFLDLEQDSGSYVSSANLIHWYRLGRNSAALGEDVVGTLDLSDASVDSSNIVADYPNQPEAGSTGATGETGATGASGETGATGAFILNVSSTGETATIADSTTLELATSGGITLTLPSAATVGSGFVVNVKDSLGNATLDPITIEGFGAETIDGALTASLTQDFDSFTFVSDGTNWVLI